MSEEESPAVQAPQTEVSPSSEVEEDGFVDLGSVTPESDEEAAPAGEAPATPKADAQQQQTQEAQPPAEGKPGAQEPEKDQTVPYKRFSKVYGYAKQLERENAQLKAQQGPPGQPGQQQAQQPQQPAKPRPTEDQFDTWEKYQDAVTDWKADQRVDQRLAQFQQQTAVEAHQREMMALETSFDQRLAEGAAKIEGYDTVEPYIPIPLAEIVLRSENPAALAHYWGKNPEEAMALLNLPPILAAREVGKLEARLAPPTAPKPRTEQTEFPPVKTVGGQETAPGKKVEDMSQEEYNRHMNKRDGITY